MRMQLRFIYLAVFSILTTISVAQDSTKTSINLDDVEISFLTSYYIQDGNHSPVTGGIGTEKLTNIAPSIVLNVPIDTVHSISLLVV